MALWSDANLSGSDEFIDLRERLAYKIRKGVVGEYDKTYDDERDNYVAVLEELDTDYDDNDIDSGIKEENVICI